MKTTRIGLVLLAAALCVATVQSALAQSYPNKLIRFVVPYSPGTSPDIVARLLAEEMSKTLGQPIIVENRGGADGAIGMEYVLHQPADGYTVLSGITSNLAILPLTAKNLRFDPLKDLPPVIGAVEGRYVFLSPAAVPWNSFEELVAHAKAHPDKLNSGSPTPQVRMSNQELFRGLGVSITDIPYSSGGPYGTALLANEVQMGFISTSSAISFGARVKILAVTGETRRPPFNNVPTLKELGRPDLPGLSFTLNVAAGTPAPVVATLHDAAAKALALPALRKRFEDQGFDVLAESAEDATRRLADQSRFFSDAAKRAGIKPE
ncbi:MAG: tripartite tricarboxylate transporter substrate binding protein [Proteobacteria bacterium]|nr:tripartite tricarboxylate transporter substrate binding protein [Pseudomonadota bacterium]